MRVTFHLGSLAMLALMLGSGSADPAREGRASLASGPLFENCGRPGRIQYTL